MTWVKICGMTNLEDALVAVDAGADAVGFVFYEKSPRCVTVETVREICEKLPESVEKVGVFVELETESDHSAAANGTDLIPVVRFRRSCGSSATIRKRRDRSALPPRFRVAQGIPGELV